MLNAQAVAGLEAGTGMTPEEQRQIQQASRAAYAARGMGGTNAAIGDELIQQYNLGQALLRQRQAFGTQMAGVNQAIYDPMYALTGRASSSVQGAPAWATGVLGTAQTYNPESAYAGNIYNANQAYQAMFADPSTMSKIGTISDMTGSFLGSVAGAMI